jgi:hypothetical protein
MKCQLIQTKDFEETVEDLIARRKLKKEDFEDFKKKFSRKSRARRYDYWDWRNTKSPFKISY